MKTDANSSDDVNYARGRKYWLKYFSLIAFVFQSTFIVVLIRYTKLVYNKNEPPYLASTVVLFSEITKLIICLLITFFKSSNLRKL